MSTTFEYTVIISGRNIDRALEHIGFGMDGKPRESVSFPVLFDLRTLPQLPGEEPAEPWEIQELSDDQVRFMFYCGQNLDKPFEAIAAALPDFVLLTCAWGDANQTRSGQLWANGHLAVTLDRYYPDHLTGPFAPVQNASFEKARLLLPRVVKGCEQYEIVEEHVKWMIHQAMTETERPVNVQLVEDGKGGCCLQMWVERQSDAIDDTDLDRLVHIGWRI